MATMYQLKTEYIQLLEMMEDPEIDPEVLNDTMEGLSGEIEDKAESYVVVIKELEGEIEKRMKEVNRLERDIKSLSGNVDRIKNVLFETMKETGKTKVPTEHFKLSIQKNGGLQPLVITADVPMEYMKVKYEPNGQKIRDALKNGELPFVHLGERGSHLVIK